jgi:hypothetical protein
MGSDCNRHPLFEALKRKFGDPSAQKNTILKLQSFKQIETLESYLTEFTLSLIDMNLKEEMLCIWFCWVLNYIFDSNKIGRTQRCWTTIFGTPRK